MPALPPERSHISRSPDWAQPAVASLAAGSLAAGSLAAGADASTLGAAADGLPPVLLQAATSRTATIQRAVHLKRFLIPCSSHDPSCGGAFASARTEDLRLGTGHSSMSNRVRTYDFTIFRQVVRQGCVARSRRMRPRRANARYRPRSSRWARLWAKLVALGSSAYTDANAALRSQ